MPVKIGEMLQKEGLITPQQLQEALTHQKQNGIKLGRALVSLGFVKDDEITGLLSRQYGVPSINLATFDIDATVLKVLPGETCRKYQVIPISRAGAVLSLAMSDPTTRPQALGVTVGEVLDHPSIVTRCVTKRKSPVQVQITELGSAARHSPSAAQ